MLLSKLTERLSFTLLQGSLDTEISTLVYDSRKAEPASVFVCISGSVRDAHDFIPDVAAKGASVVIVEKQVLVPEHLTVLLVTNAREALACLSAAYFGYPAEQLRTIGITGTKGKTTVSYMIHSILNEAGIKTGLIGTIETIIGTEHIPAANTTPESYLVQQYFKKMLEAGCTCVVMEVSSQGLMLHRVSGFVFDYGVFTNLEPDHIGTNEHKDFEDYMHCKSLLFRQCRLGILNQDSEHLSGILKDHTCEVETFGCSPAADLYAQNIQLYTAPGVLGVQYRLGGILDFDVTVDIPGVFSVYNSLTAIAVCRHFGVSASAMQNSLPAIRVKGRIELLRIAPHFTLMIDYAHNSMSLKSLLTTLREYKPKRLICLFGCGGNRDKARRYEMGEVSSRYAELSVITSDNPRDEEPMSIIEDILTGVRKADGSYVTIPDRKDAIRYCIDHAQEGDVIVLAGKGHEDYQEIKGIKHHMDERELVYAILKEGNYPWKL